jgi:hypothetical protein
VITKPTTPGCSEPRQLPITRRMASMTM